MTSNKVPQQNGRGTPTAAGDVDHTELNNIIDTLLEVRQNIRHD